MQYAQYAAHQRGNSCNTVALAKQKDRWPLNKSGKNDFEVILYSICF